MPSAHPHIQQRRIVMDGGLDDEKMHEAMERDSHSLHAGDEIQFCHTKDGIVSGPYLSFKKSGAGGFHLHEAGRNIDGKPHGQVTLYGADGHIDGKLNYCMGNKQGMFRYYRDGVTSRVECWKNNFPDPRLTKKMERRRRWLEVEDFVLMQMLKLGDLLRGKPLRTPQEHVAWRDRRLQAYYDNVTTSGVESCQQRTRPVGMQGLAVARTAYPDGTVVAQP